MVSITYKGESNQVEWFGVAFDKGKSVDTDNEALIKAAGNNRLFEVKVAPPPLPPATPPLAPDTPFDRGATAAIEKKERSVPAAYRGKPEGVQWLGGFDSVTAKT